MRIKVPDVDRAKIDAKSIIAVVINIQDDEFYQLGTKAGKLKSLYTRNQFTLCKENFISIEEVGKEEISVREVVGKLYFIAGQGFKKCIFLKKWSTKTCVCKSSSICVILNTIIAKLVVTRINIHNVCLTVFVDLDC